MGARRPWVVMPAISPVNCRALAGRGTAALCPQGSY